MGEFIFLYSIILTVNIFWLFGFFIRLVGIETRRWSTTSSIFQIINLFPRTIGVLQIPLITLYTETAINRKEQISELFYQGVIFFNMLGLLIGLVVLPIFLHLLRQLIDNIYEKTSFNVLLRNQTWKNIPQSFLTFDYRSFYFGLRLFEIRVTKIFVNNFVAAFLTCIAMPACLLAGYELPEYRATIISFVSVIYGISTFITILLIDTRVSVLSDQTFDGVVGLHQYKEVLFECLKGRLVGITMAIIILPYFSDMIVLIVANLLF
jgi:hypothetical protein